MNQTFSFYTMACRLVVVLLASMMAITSTVSSSIAGVDQWTVNGPEGGVIRSLAIDPSNPAIIYAGTSRSVFKSTNGGNSWSAANSGLLYNGLYVDVLAIDPANPLIIYAGTWGGGIFKSTTGGSSWNEVNNGLTYAFLDIYALAIDPTNSAIIYAGTLLSG